MRKLVFSWLVLTTLVSVNTKSSTAGDGTDIHVEFMGCVWVLDSSFTQVKGSVSQNWNRIINAELQSVQFHEDVLSANDFKDFTTVEDIETNAMGQYKVVHFRTGTGNRVKNHILIKSEDLTISLMNFDKKTLSTFWQFCNQ